MSPILQLLAAGGALFVIWVAGARVLRIAGGFLVATAIVAVLVGVPGHKVIATAVTGVVGWLAGQVIARAQNGYWPSTLLEALGPNSRPRQRLPARRRPTDRHPSSAPGAAERRPRP